MKNLFKNLMLVAVAAMAFTACTETNDEVNAVSKKTVLNGVVGFAEETRSGFSEETSTNDEGKTVYHSEWDGNESILVVCNGQAKTAPITKNDEGNANFTVEFDGELGDLYYVSVYSPASAFDQSGYCTIPSEQTPRANSVDPAAHALSVSSTPVSAGSAYFAMQHSAAYGKMTINGVEFAIDHIVVDLKGSYYGSARECSYTINADNVQNNTFWFATEPIDVAEFTVTAYDEEDNAVAKTVDVAAAGKTMSFQYGRVGTFSVSGLEAVVEPEGNVFTSAMMYQQYTAGSDYQLQFANEDYNLIINLMNVYNDGAIVPGVYSGDDKIDTGYSSLNNKDLYTINMDVKVVNNEYFITFTNVTYAGGTMPDTTYTGLISGFDVYDPRTPLATPEVTYELNGKTLTVSWTPVDGAVGYYVHDYYYDVDTTTTDATLTVELSEYKWYYIYVTALAVADDATFKNSAEAEISFELKDPNKFADVMATNIQWDSEGYFTLTAPGFSYINLEVNSANRPNNNSLVVGDYTYGKNENQFRVKYNNGFAFGYGDIVNTSTMTVNFVDDQYVILLDITSLYGGFVGTIGYKGMPEGWVAPSEGGDEPVNPEPEPDPTPDPDPDQPEQGEGNELGSESNPYTFSSVASNGFFLNFEGAENGASLQLDRQNSDVNQMSNYGGPFALNYTAIIYAGSGCVYNDGKNVYQYASFAPYSTLEVTKADGNWTCKLKMSVDEGATFTYYTYTGQIANQAY